MSRRFCWIVVAVFAGVLALPAVVLVQSDEDGRVPPTKDWPFIGGDWTNARYSALTQIHTQNVRQLGGAWVKKFDRGASTRATPVVKDGLMFIGAGTQVSAINAKTGDTVWTWVPDEQAGKELEAAGIAQMLNSGRSIPAPPGLSLGEGLVFVGLTDGRLAALRQKTGELVWATRLGEDPPKTGESVSGAPIYARGVVFSGLANGDWAFRGKVLALDAKTGKKLWEFFTIPGPGEPGHETWPQDSEVWKQGGGGVWHIGNVDVDLGMVYFVTGNAVPMFGGEARKGDNLYTASILAFDMKTGQLRWHYQVVHHDLWDADIAIAPVLYDAQVNGQRRKALAALRADGYFFLVDRETGTPVFPVEERPVTQDPYNFTSPTQPFPVGAEALVPGCDAYRDRVAPPFVLDCSGFTPPYVDKHNVVGPGMPIPSVRVTPFSYSPQTGYFYAQGNGGVGRARRISDDPWFRGNANTVTNLPPGTGVLAAIDGRTNKIVWKKEIPSGILGGSGPLTTAGGLLFRGSGDGNVEGYDAKNGQLLWQFQTGVAGARGPSVTYEVDGEQYVALSMGPVMWAFKLGGTLTPQPAPSRAAGGGGGPGGEGGPGGGAGGGGRQTDEIETATLVQSAERGVGNRYALDEHAFNPARARVKAGTRVSFVNNGRLTHTIVAQDGSWTAGTLKMAQSGFVTFNKPGTLLYQCKEHPWAMGQVTVEP